MKYFRLSYRKATLIVRNISTLAENEEWDPTSLANMALSINPCESHMGTYGQFALSDLTFARAFVASHGPKARPKFTRISWTMKLVNDERGRTSVLGFLAGSVAFYGPVLGVDGSWTYRITLVAVSTGALLATFRYFLSTTNYQVSSCYPLVFGPKSSWTAY